MSAYVKHQTAYGDVWIGPDCVAIAAETSSLYVWAHRSGAHWPCSDLADLDCIRAEFDTNGLLDLAQRPAYDEETGLGEVPGDEFNAWSSDLLREVLPHDHPCYFVTVGQFEDGGLPS